VGDAHVDLRFHFRFGIPDGLLIFGVQSREFRAVGSEDAAAAARPLFRNSLREREYPRRMFSTPFWRGLSGGLSGGLATKRQKT
jgi:hypothetical protein